MLMPRYDLLLVESELNRMLRPNIKPHLPYCRSPRHAGTLIAEYRTHIQWIDDYVFVTTRAGEASASATSPFTNDKERSQALCYAVGKSVMSALHIIEQQEKDKHVRRK